jgi:hypothetical protein
MPTGSKQPSPRLGALLLTSRDQQTSAGFCKYVESGVHD